MRGDRRARGVHLVVGNADQAELDLVDDGVLRHFGKQTVLGMVDLHETGRLEGCLRPFGVGERERSGLALAGSGRRGGGANPASGSR